MIVVIDNRDSFTFNLVQELQTLTAVQVHRGAEVSAEEVFRLSPRGILIGPGPGRPAGAGCSEEIVRRRAQEAAGPVVLGVCLGHQAFATALGGELRRATELVHGAVRPMSHGGDGVLRGLPNPFPMARYNSLVIHEPTLPEVFRVTGRTADGDIAALAHRTLPMESVQGHPESVLSVDAGGRTIFANFVERCTRAGRA